MSARVLDLSHDAYIGDPCETPSLSTSIAHTLLTRSPLHAWTEHPRLGNKRPAPTVEMDDGTIIHGLLLESGPQLDVIKADNYRTKAAQELRDAARDAGRVPVLEHKLHEMIGIAAKLLKNLSAFGI